MSFNYNLTPCAYKEISHKSLKLSLPLYGDLTGEEFDVLEKLEIHESKWNQKLMELVDKLATSKNMSLYEISQLMNKAEMSTNMAEKLNLLGDFLPEFMSLLESKPSESKRVTELATAMLRRVDTEASVEKTMKLPRTFRQKLAEVYFQEQTGEGYLPYEEILTSLKASQAEAFMYKSIVDSLKVYLKTVDNPSIEAVVKLVNQVEESKDQIKKPDFTTGTEG